MNGVKMIKSSSVYDISTTAYVPRLNNRAYGARVRM